MDFRKMDLEKLNTLTKYPSIPTYHLMVGNRGLLGNECIDFKGEPVIATEKVDGTNSRLIISGDNVIIGSREELLHNVGDLIYNPILGIVNALIDLARRCWCPEYELCVCYLETYGYGTAVKGVKNYTSTGKTGYRLFDIISLDDDEVEEVLSWPIEKIAAWRDSGRQLFLPEENLALVANHFGIQMTPRLATLNKLPTDHDSMYILLNDLAKETKCALDEGARKFSEGIVFRTENRDIIAKARFEDYEKTIAHNAGINVR
jgi:hypothetical protein